MNVPLRVLSWAVRFFWIIALAFAVTSVYSATLIRVNFGEPATALSGEDFTVTLPIIFDNRGYYDIANLNITTIISDYNNTQISRAVTYVRQVRPQDHATFLHNVSFNLNEIIAWTEYLFNDSNFVLHGSVRLDYANLIPFGFEANRTIPWGAPLYDFAVGIPQFVMYNITHLRANVPISFENHSPYFSVTGTIRVEVFNSGNLLIGEGIVSMDVPTYGVYDGILNVLVNGSMMTASGEIQVFVETAMFNYGPMVIAYG